VVLLHRVALRFVLSNRLLEDNKLLLLENGV